MKPEILAPCGSIESFYAAIEAGCDAVYLAGKMFGARSFATNFTNEELVDVINYAHLYGVKVYITCNILIYEREVDAFLNYVEFLHKNNVDALIMQDIGMIDLVHKTFPNLEIHASTQVHIHNLDGALMASKLGIKRIVLARETPLEEIASIKKETDLEIEVFVHGALCASYSGMCLFASSIGPRSGNRGTCSGCCRLPYQVTDQNNNRLNQGDYPLSMKDLMTLSYLDKLIDIGIDSFKIEGRMKSPAYVYTVTKLYKETRDTYLKEKILKINETNLYRLQTIFARKYTKGFILNENSKDIVDDTSPNHKGILIGKVIKSENKRISILLDDSISIHDGLRIINNNFEYGVILNQFYKEKKRVYEANKKDIITLTVNKEIPLFSQVYKTYSYQIDNLITKEIKSKKRKIPISFTITVLKDKNISLSVTDTIHNINLELNKPETAIKKSITKEEIKEKLEKINDSIYSIKSININLDENLFVPIKEINHLKQEIISLLNKERINDFKKDFQKETYKLEVPNFEKVEAYTLLTNDQDLISKKYSFIYSEIIPNTILKLPKVVKKYDTISQQEYLVGEIGGLFKLKNIITDYSFNITNSYGVALLHSLGVKRVTLSLELNNKDINDLVIAYKKRYQKLPNLELIIKTRIEVMVLKFKLKEKYLKDTYYLIDRFKNKYQIVYKNDLMYLYDYKERKLEDQKKYFDLGINYLREEIHFETENY